MKDQALKQSLSRVAPLDAKNAMVGSSRCKICGGLAALFDVVDFNKAADGSGKFYPFGFAGIPVHYRRCRECGLIFTEFCDDWTTEDFAAHIYNGDYIKVDGEYAEIRPLAFAASMAERFGGHRQLRILDYGSGSGVFVNRLRQLGFAASEGYDPFSSPARPEGRFDVLTCLEVLEHTADPAGTVADMKGFLRDDGCILFSQALQPADIAFQRCNWWYAAPRNGHVSLYTEESLASLARGVGLTFCPGNGIHAFLTPEPSESTRFLVRDLGTPLFVTRLLAPAGEGGPAGFEARAVGTGWHGLEAEASGSFRWSATDRLAWAADRVAAYPCTLRLRLRFVNQIEPDFAARCRFRVNGAERAAALAGAGKDTLSADFPLASPAPIRIELVTPEPVCPFEAGRGPDRRRLGIAVPALA